LTQQEKGFVNLIYALQWVVYHLGVIISVPLMVGSALNLNPAETTLLLQTGFALTGIASLIQVLWGHGMLLIEGPVAPWGAAYVILAGIALNTGRPLSLLRTDIEGAMLIVGIVMIILGASGFLRWAKAFFTPRITGMLLLLLGIQIGMVSIEGVTDSTWQMILTAVAVVVIIAYLSLNGRGLAKSSAAFIGVLIGWFISFLLGEVQIQATSSILSLPRLFPWGRPTFEAGTTISLLLLSFMLIANIVGSISAAENTFGGKISLKRYDRGLAVSGFSNLLTGLTGCVGTMPFAISVSLVSLTGLKKRLPFLLASLIFLAMGFFAPLGALVGSIPQPIASAVLLIAGSSLAIIGIKDITREEVGNRESFVIGLPLLLGVGVMMLPSVIWQAMPAWAVGILSNGVVFGVLICIILEHFILPLRHKEN